MLSVIAQYMIIIRNGLLCLDKDTIILMDQELKINNRIGIFITMNPDYEGRQQLPENLKMLLRPVSMMIPNYQYICEVSLYSQGFINSKELANKMIQLYQLASSQLSQCKHYDFGMRDVKRVLTQSAKLKQV